MDNYGRLGGSFIQRFRRGGFNLSFSGVPLADGAEESFAEEELEMAAWHVFL